MVEETRGESEREINPSDDALIIGGEIEYIGEGLHAIARAIERLAKAQEGEEPPQEQEYYLDGTRK